MSPKWLDETSQSLLEFLHLDSIFEDNNIPPIAFPLGIILLALLLLFSFSSTSEEFNPSSSCGDKVCDSVGGEDVITCPRDCVILPLTERTVQVTIDNPSKYPLEVSLEDSAGTLVQKKKDRTSTFTFSVDSSVDEVRAFILNTVNSEVINSDLVSLTNEVTKIDLSSNSDFLADMVISWQQASLRVNVEDSVTGEAIMANVTVSIPQTLAADIKVESKIVYELDHFSLESGTWYIIAAKAEGYENYYNQYEYIILESEESREITLLLDPIGISKPSTGLKVCIYDEKWLSLNGSVLISDIFGNEIETKSTMEGCTEFTLIEGHTVVASSLNLPDFCLSFQQELTLQKDNNEIGLVSFCDSENISQVRLRVLNEFGDVLTHDATIIARYVDGEAILGANGSNIFEVGSAGYTEFIKVQALKPFQFRILNLDSYENTISAEYTLQAAEISSITITLSQPPIQRPVINLEGLTYPKLVVTGASFEVIIPQIIFSNTDITDRCKLTVSFAGSDCEVTRDNYWIASCLSSKKLGNQDLAIGVTYNNQNAFAINQIFVYLEGTGTPFELMPRPLEELSMPILASFDVSFEGEPLDSLTGSEVTIEYLTGEVILEKVFEMNGSDGVYFVLLNTPFLGKHRATIKLQKLIDVVLYEQEFSYDFTSYTSDLEVDTSLIPVALEPLETFMVYARISSEDELFSGLTNLYASLNDGLTNLIWSPFSEVYKTGLKAPLTEAAYDLEILLSDETIADSTFYVVDTSQEKSPECRIDDCSTMQMVRKCVEEYKHEEAYTQTQIISCMESGIYTRSYSLFDCKSLSANRGDFNGDCELDSDDLTLFSQLLNSVSQSERNTYKYCGDMDNDGDVDDEDSICLQNLIQGIWGGDTSARGNDNGVCMTEMFGAFCLDTSDTPGDFNGDWVFDDNDVTNFINIKNAVFEGVTPTEKILSVADFNQDGQISTSDVNCIESIIDSIIPSYCLEIYDFDCGISKGDLNQDGVINRMDLLLEGWVVEGRVINGCDTCTDLNADEFCTYEDLLCLTALADQDNASIYDYCTPCVTKMTNLGLYGEEICNDGYDNDCNGEIDDLCECNQEQDCMKKYDRDGIAGGDDYLYCRSLSWAGWQWISDEVLMNECQTCEDLEKEFTCENFPPAICLDKCDHSTAWATKNPNDVWPEGVSFVGNDCKQLAEFMKPDSKKLCCHDASGPSGKKDCGSTSFSDPSNPCPSREPNTSTNTLFSPIPPRECDACCVEGSCNLCAPIVIVNGAPNPNPSSGTSGGGSILFPL